MLHSEIRKSLMGSLESGRVFQAVIFEGPEGIGKKTLARDFAMALHCESNEKKPCGICPSCVKHKTGNHPDYFELTLQKDKKSIPVASVRSACEELFIKPVISDRKILFIPEADLCEAPAQNAMLKCFEEPPPYAVIILAAKDMSSLLDTIKSRAAIYTLNPCPSEEIKEFLLKNYPEKASEADFIAAFSDGIIGQAKLLCENEELSLMRKEFLSLLSEFGKSRYRALKAADFISDNPDSEEFLFGLLLSFFRDATALCQGCENIINADFFKEIKSFAASSDKKGLVRALSFLTKAKNDKSKNANYSLFITELVIRLWEVLHG